MDVLVDDSLVPLWIHGLLGIFGPSLVVRAETEVFGKTLELVNPA